MRRLCVFLGSAGGADHRIQQAVREFGGELVRRGMGLVYGGGRVGLMGILADAVLAAGGEVVGVIPKSLSAKEIAHYDLADLRIVATMHERKALMADLADGFVAFPGGLGTMDELCEILTWAQLGIHAKPCGLVNVGGFFDAFLAHLERAEREGFLKPAHRRLLLVGRTGNELLDLFDAYRPAAPSDKLSREDL